MARAQYTQAIDGVWQMVPNRRHHRLRCCDCGLVHDAEFRVRKGKIEFQVFRNARATAQIRRHQKR